MNGKKTNVSTSSNKGKEKLLTLLDKSLSTGTAPPFRGTGPRLYGHAANNNAVHSTTSTSSVSSQKFDRPNSITVDARQGKGWRRGGKGKGKPKHYGPPKKRGKISVGQQGNGRKHPRTTRSSPVETDRGMVGVASAGKKFELKTKFKSSSSTNKNTVIVGTELINNIIVPQATYNTLGAIAYELELNPILMNKTKLGQYGKLNEFFRFDYLDIHIEGAGASLDRGNLGIALSIDPEVKFNSPGINNVRTLLSLPYCKQLKPWMNATLNFKHQLNKFFAIKPTGDPRLWDQGKFILFIYSPLSPADTPTNYTLGNIWINYKVQFKSAVMQNVIPGGSDILETSPIVSTTIQQDAGDQFQMANANFGNLLEADGIYQLLVLSNWTCGGAPIVLGPDSNTVPMNLGTVWFIKRNTEQNRFMFYSAMPSADPTETEGAMIVNNPAGLTAGQTYAGNFKAFYVTSLNQ